MTAVSVACDSRPYVFLGLIAAIFIGYEVPYASTTLIIALIIQMTLSLDGMSFKGSDFKEYKNEMIWCLVASFVVNMGITLATGYFFMDDIGLWYGWVMLAIAPCAISTVTAAIYMNGDMKMSVLGLVMVYIVSIFLTPILSHVMIGDAVNPLEILKYILLFIIVPFALTIPLRRFHLKRTPKVIGINLMMFCMVFMGLGSRHDYLWEHVDSSLFLVIACVLRICVIGTLLIVIMRKARVKRENAVIYSTMMYWKNSSMMASMCMALLGATYPEASLPCVISLVVEAAWFSILTRLMSKIWPEEKRKPVSTAS